jgi:catechol 1,2-dioxygenase
MSTTGGAPLFDEARSAEVVNARMGPAADPRLREVMNAIVRHLHAAVKESRPTQEEWLSAIEFLTATGRMCTDWRQEFILLSDILGVSMLVDALNHRRSLDATANTILGPFYVPQAPRYPRGANICLDGKGEPLSMSGRVLDTDGKPIAGALIDIWQTNDDGFYDVQQKGVQPDWNLRGVFQTHTDGSYRFRSVKPRPYPIPDDGPVGQLLRRMGRHPFRASHIHFIVSAPGHDTLVTHVFPPDCPYLHEDAVFGVKASLVADFRCCEGPGSGEEADMKGPYWSVTWDFVLDRTTVKAGA